MKNSIYSLLVPWFFEGSSGLMQTAMPLLAVHLGATAITLGLIGWIAQAVRLPMCFVSGHISEKTGRKTLIVLSCFTIAVACLAFVYAKSTIHIIIFYSLAWAAIGGFYPPLQAHIADVSEKGQLTRNLGMFNVGWCVGGGVMAMAAARLVKAGLPATFIAAACGCALAGLLAMTWGQNKNAQLSDVPVSDQQPTQPKNATLLLIARMGCFTGYIGFSMMRVLFPKVGLSTLHWPVTTVALAVSFLPMGQGAGMLATNISPWWRGKIWPQISAQCVMLACGVIIAFNSSIALIIPAFFVVGFSISIAYTTALYHGMSGSNKRGLNGAIQEGLVAVACIFGCIVGGILAQKISPHAPYALFAGLMIICLAASAIIWARRSSAGISINPS